MFDELVVLLILFIRLLAASSAGWTTRAGGASDCGRTKKGAREKGLESTNNFG